MKHVSLLPFDQEKDGALLEKWLAAPHVRRWWGDPEKIRQEMADPPSSGGEALIGVDAKPIGYIRWQVPTARELIEAGLNDLPARTMDIDIAIGEMNYLGRGIAAQALRILVDQLREAGTTPLIIMCTSIENHHAIRAFEKAGFKRNRVFNDPEYGKMWLLTFKGNVE